MRFLLWSINHQSAPLALREQVALAGPALDALHTQLRALNPHLECVVLSTCNRTEIYFTRASHDPPQIQDLTSLVAEITGAPASALAPVVLHQENEQALVHLFRVASGLESMVLGEPQILGQVKRAYEESVRMQSVGPVLHRVFQQAIATAKNVRNFTGIDQGRLSVGSIAVDFARQIFDSFSDKTILAIGAGEMTKVTLRHLQSENPRRLLITNRTHQRAVDLAASLNLSAPQNVRPFTELDELLVEADIILTSTAAPCPILTPATFKTVLRRRKLRPLFIIDLAVPRDVDPAVGSLTNVYLYNIDDLGQVAGQNAQERKLQAEEGQALVQAAAQACLSEIQNRDLGRLIKALRHRLHDLGQAERERTLRKLLALPPDRLHDELPGLMEEHTHRLVNKILHVPLAQLDHRQSEVSPAFYAAALRRLFALDDKPDAEQ